MGSAKAKTVERGNPVIPAPPVPSKVQQSNLKPDTVTEPSPPPATQASSELLDRKVKVSEKAKGKITVYIFDGKPYETEFEGDIAGFEMNIAVPAMRKGYKVWKHNQSKQGGK